MVRMRSQVRSPLSALFYHQKIWKRKIYTHQKKMKNFYFLFIKENKKIFFKTFFFFWLASLIHGYNTHNPYEENFSFFIFILHTINLIFHEAGHPLMSIFGTIPGIFGGTLFQIGIPAVCVFYFLLKKEYFSSGVVTLWVSSNF